MAQRIIRPELITSDKYWNVTLEAQRLYIHMLLRADDIGLIKLAPRWLMSQCYGGSDLPTHERLSLLLQQLADADLIRTYTANNALFAFIPQFGQRLQIIKLKCPPPPPELYADDEEAKRKFSKVLGIKDLTAKPTVDHGESPLPTVPHGDPPPEVEVEVEDEVEVEKNKRKKTMVGSFDPPSPPEDTPSGSAPAKESIPLKRIIALFAKHCPQAIHWQTVNEKRKQTVRARWKEVLRMGSVQTREEGLAWFDEFFAKVAASKVLMGETEPGPNRKPFDVSLDWLLAPTNFAKVIDGQYANDRGKATADTARASMFKGAL